MRYVMVRYRVKADRAGENLRFVKAVFEQLHAEEPEGVRYASFHLPDGASFVHFAALESEENVLATLASFRAFTSDIAARCDEPPVARELTAVGSYRLFG